MVGNKRLKTDELQVYPPHGHPRSCPEDPRLPETVHRGQKIKNFRKQRKEKKMP